MRPPFTDQEVIELVIMILLFLVTFGSFFYFCFKTFQENKKEEPKPNDLSIALEDNCKAEELDPERLEKIFGRQFGLQKAYWTDGISRECRNSDADWWYRPYQWKILSGDFILLITKQKDKSGWGGGCRIFYDGYIIDLNRDCIIAKFSAGGNQWRKEYDHLTINEDNEEYVIFTIHYQREEISDHYLFDKKKKCLDRTREASMNKCLFIDDDADFLRSIQWIFHDKSNVAFAECHSVREALTVINVYKPNILFLDHELSKGGNEGLEITECLRGKMKIYSTTTRTELSQVYQRHGVELIGKRELNKIRAIIGF